MNLVINLCSFMCILSFTSLPSFAVKNVHFLEQGDVFNHQASPYRGSQFHVFCYEGKPKYIIHLWQSVILQINHSTDEYTQFDGATPQIVQTEYFENRNSWSFNIFTSKQKNLKLNPFNTSCIGIDSKDDYTIHLNVIRIDLWKLLLLAVGILLFISAEKLSCNTAFHFICGTTFGVCASFLILIYFISKIFPKKPFMYGVLGCGWTIVIYVLQILWDNIRNILLNYKSYVIWYIIITGIVSFILCYRWGPVENQRTKNLIKWSLQITGLVSIFFSSHFQEAAMGQIVLLLLGYNLPSKWVAAPGKLWKIKFPPKVKLITTDEYYEQGLRETARALDELRNFCSSPKCNQWKTALQLKDVKRFASFIEGNSHLSDEELLDYETSVQGELTDEEEEENSELLTDEDADEEEF